MDRISENKIANRILLALPPATRRQIGPYLTRVDLRRGQVIYHPDDQMDKLYFIDRGLVSLVRTMSDGRTVEIGAIGIEGLTGIDALFGMDASVLEAIVQLPGTALCCNANDLRTEVMRDQSLAHLLQRYFHLAIAQIAQTAACNRLHTLEQRCCRWLLIAHDSARSDDFELTHEFLSMMLGVRRPGVSTTANALRKAGFIRYARGRVTVTDRAGLEAAACECYGTIRILVDRLFQK